MVLGKRAVKQHLHGMVAAYRMTKWKTRDGRCPGLTLFACSCLSVRACLVPRKHGDEPSSESAVFTHLSSASFAFCVPGQIAHFIFFPPETCVVIHSAHYTSLSGLFDAVYPHSLLFAYVAQVQSLCVPIRTEWHHLRPSHWFAVMPSRPQKCSFCPSHTGQM